MGGMNDEKAPAMFCRDPGGHSPILNRLRRQKHGVRRSPGILLRLGCQRRRSRGEAGGSLSGSGAAAPLPNKVIYDGSAELEAKYPGQAMRAVEQEIRRLGGYVASSSIQRGEEAGDDWVEMELKIPAEQLEGMEAFLGSLGTVTDYAMQSEDVTNQYYDAQARLENAKTQRDAYLEMLEQAKTVEDALKVQEALDSVQERIEVLEGQLKLWDHQVSVHPAAYHLRPHGIGGGAAALDELG